MCPAVVVIVVVYCRAIFVFVFSEQIERETGQGVMRIVVLVVGGGGEVFLYGRLGVRRLKGEGERVQKTVNRIKESVRKHNNNNIILIIINMLLIFILIILLIIILITLNS